MISNYGRIHETYSGFIVLLCIGICEMDVVRFFFHRNLLYLFLIFWKTNDMKSDKEWKLSNKAAICSLLITESLVQYEITK